MNTYFELWIPPVYSHKYMRFSFKHQSELPNEGFEITERLITVLNSVINIRKKERKKFWTYLIIFAQSNSVRTVGDTG